MQKMLILAVIVTVVVTGTEAQAAVRRVRPVSAGQGQVNQSQGPVNRLIELERRKNAALKQMFFSR